MLYKLVLECIVLIRSMLRTWDDMRNESEHSFCTQETLEKTVWLKAVALLSVLFASNQPL